MHRQGINLRYLGSVRRLVPSAEVHIRKVLLTEMVVRTLRTMLAKAMRRIPNLNVVRPAIYMNRDALDAFDLQMNRDPLLQFRTQETAQGKFVTTFWGVPIRRVDQILSTEAGVA